MEDFYFDNLDPQFCNPNYPISMSEGLNPIDIFTAPDGHLYTPEEIANMSNMPSTNLPIEPIVSIEHPSFDLDPNGGVVVTDITGTTHHYNTMEQAQRMTDVMSGFPVTVLSPGSFVPQSGCTGCPNNPTDIHTPVDLKYYDEKVADAQARLVAATKDIENLNDFDQLEDARRRAENAKNDIRYWEDCRTQSSFDQTIDNIKSDKIINDANRAAKELHDTLHHNSMPHPTDYTNDIMMQMIDWSKVL